MKKRMAIMLLVAGIVFGGIVAWHFVLLGLIAKGMSSFVPPAETVTTTKVQSITWSPALTSVGTVTAEQSVNITPEVAGTIEKIFFQSGQTVKQGQPLVDLDTSNQMAQLKADQAQLKLAQLNYERNKKLYQRHVIASSDLDSSFATLESTQAAVQGDKATIAKMHIVAPFAGKLGIRQVSVGQYIAQQGSNTSIVSISSIDPMLVQFSLPQQNLPNVTVGQAIQLTVDAYPGRTFTGYITATNESVTSDSRTILVEARVANPKQELVAGMFAMVNVMLPPVPNVLIVPQTAIVYSLYGNSVYVAHHAKAADKDGKLVDQIKVSQVFVSVGEVQGINIAITSGLAAGDEVVTSGQLKLHNGSVINVDNKVQPN